MTTRTLAGYVLAPTEKPWPEEGEQTVFVYDEAAEGKWAVVVYTPAGVRGYAEIAGRAGCEVTLIERGLIASDLEPATLRAAVAFAAQTQRSVNWLAGFGREPWSGPPAENPRVVKLFEVEVEALYMPPAG